jgi:hypothetical protein
MGGTSYIDELVPDVLEESSTTTNQTPSLVCRVRLVFLVARTVNDGGRSLYLLEISAWERPNCKTVTEEHRQPFAVTPLALVLSYACPIPLLQ